MSNIAAAIAGGAGILGGLHAVVIDMSPWGYVAWICGVALFAVGVVRDYE